VGLLHEPLQISFDYAIKNGKPKSLDAESKNWEIPLEVTATANKNMDFCANYCMKTLDALSLSKEEVRDYQNLNKHIYPITINFKKFTKIYYLRKESSMNALSLLTDHWAYYTHLFIVQPEMGLLNGRVEMQIHDFSINRKEGKTINFLTSGQQAATFSWQDKRTLTQIEQLTSYTVKPKGVISQFKHDNFVVYDENGLEFVEQMPECLDGNNTLFADILNNLNYPKNAVDANVEGSVHINFVVNVDGSISDIQLVLGIGYGCDEEALRVIRKLSKCVPRTKDGNPVSTRFNLKITFDLD
jgi:TonB family protein